MIDDATVLLIELAHQARMRGELGARTLAISGPTGIEVADLRRRAGQQQCDRLVVRSLAREVDRGEIEAQCPAVDVPTRGRERRPADPGVRAFRIGAQAMLDWTTVVERDGGEDVDAGATVDQQPGDGRIVDEVLQWS